jgi:hypothetical protein
VPRDVEAVVDHCGTFMEGQMWGKYFVVRGARYS